MERFKDFIWAIFHPSYWTMVGAYSKQWNTKLNLLMKTHKFERFDTHGAKIGGVVVWIKNHPYGSFTPYEFLRTRPSRRTIKKAHDKLMQDFLS